MKLKKVLVKNYIEKELLIVSHPSLIAYARSYFRANCYTGIRDILICKNK